MIAHFASVIAPQLQASEYLEYLETSAISTYESAAGLISVYLEKALNKYEALGKSWRKKPESRRTRLVAALLSFQ